MERNDAAKILQTLANGVDPATGEPFPASSPYQRADVVRALFVAMQALGSDTQPAMSATADAPTAEGSKPQKPKMEKPGLANAGRPWSQEEDARLGHAFDAGTSIELLAEAHKRSRFAIEARLVKLGRIEEPSAALRFPLQKNTAAEPAAVYPV